MRTEDLSKFLDGTKEAGFIVDGGGRIFAWNAGAERLFGVNAENAIGRYCDELVNGADERGSVCSANCQVKQACQSSIPLESFDMQVQTLDGRTWCSVVTILLRSAFAPQPFALHLFRPIEAAKHLELAAIEFIKTLTDVVPNQLLPLHAPTTIARQAKLTRREQEVLALLASGGTTREIANEMNISPYTVNNHIRSILRKTDSHRRLNAIRKAELGGLL